MRYCIFRLKETPENTKIRFHNCDALQRMKLWPVNPENYEMIYHAIDDSLDNLQVADVIESIYTKYNGPCRPKDFEAYSVSVGDIIVLDEVYPGAYFCDSIGFDFLGMRLSKEFLDRT